MSNDRPTRRRVLATAGLAATTGLAGCGGLVSAVLGGDGPPMDDRSTPGSARSVSNPDAIEFGETVEATLSSGDGIDPRYGDLAEPVAFEGEAGTVVEITMSAASFTPYLVLEGPNSLIVGNDGDANQTPRSVIWRRLPTSGTYTIWAGSYAGDATGEYALSLEESDARAAFSEFPSIEVGQTHEGEVTGAPPVDPAFGDVAAPVGVSLSDPDVVELRLRAPEFDPYLVVEGAGGAIVGTAPPGDDGTIALQLRLTGERNVAWVGSKRGDATGPFTLETSRL